jgi:6,7-dimethyl-8-ribityllumazine synthase
MPYNRAPMTERVFIEGDLNAEGLRVAVVASRFNDDIVDGLLGGALSCLERHGAAAGEILVYRVPGAFEIPTLVNRLAHKIGNSRFHAIVALGALIRGDTPHFEYISTQVTNELSRVAVDSGIPVAYGVITCNTLEQARARSGPGAGNKGWEAALAAIEMANLLKKVISDP